MVFLTMNEGYGNFMDMLKKYWSLLVIPLILCAGAFFILYRMGSNDAKSLAAFSAAYKTYDQSISDFSKSIFAGAPTSSDVEQKANEAQAELKTQASARISSLTKNDGQLMQVMQKITDLSSKELAAAAEYKNAVGDQSADISQLASAFADLTNQRQAAYARFQELAGLK